MSCKCNKTQSPFDVLEEKLVNLEAELLSEKEGLLVIKDDIDEIINNISDILDTISSVIEDVIILDPAEDALPEVECECNKSTEEVIEEIKKMLESRKSKCCKK